MIGITIAGREAVGPRGWERTWGVAAGLAGPDDGIVGLDREQPWTADFELIGPAGDAGSVAVLVDVENRGGRSTHGMIGPELAAGRLAYRGSSGRPVTPPECPSTPRASGSSSCASSGAGCGNASGCWCSPAPASRPGV